jgi:hypothetical protein
MTNQTKEILSGAESRASTGDTKSHLEQEAEFANLVASVRRISFDFFLKYGFSQEQALGPVDIRDSHRV